MTEQGKKVVGRPSLGVTKKISVTLPEKIWEWLDQEAEGNRSRINFKYNGIGQKNHVVPIYAP